MVGAGVRGARLSETHLPLRHFGDSTTILPGSNSECVFDKLVDAMGLAKRQERHCVNRFYPRLSRRFRRARPKPKVGTSSNTADGFCKSRDFIGYPEIHVQTHLRSYGVA